MFGLIPSRLQDGYRRKSAGHCYHGGMPLTAEQLADIRTRIPERPQTDIPMPYEDLVRKILKEGTLKSDRTGTGTISLFGQQMRFDLSKYFPLLTT